MQYFLGISLVFNIIFGSVAVIFFEKNKSLSLALNLQNEKIEEMRLESEAYACSLDSLNDYTRAKYEKITHDAQSCEAKLEEFEKALGIFEGR